MGPKAYQKWFEAQTALFTKVHNSIKK
jgi:hypothetical protein